MGYWRQLHRVRVTPKIMVTISIVSDRDEFQTADDVSAEARTMAALGRLLRRVALKHGEVK